MGQQEQTRLKVLNSVMVGQFPVGQAAEVLGISGRHVRRILGPTGKREQPQVAYRTPPPAAAVEQALRFRFHLPLDRTLARPTVRARCPAFVLSGEARRANV